MQGKIALEEHIAIEETASNFGTPFPDHVWHELKGRLLDVHDRRLGLMDQHGIEMMVLSLNAPAIQGIPDPARANEIARKANDYLAEQVSKRPDRFQALAALPMQDPALAAGRRQDALLRPAAISFVLGDGGKARCAVLPASA
jgi:predicted TIM-barrel fold metal-dependent hydrolase